MFGEANAQGDRRMTWKQAAFLIVVNAVLSLLISLAVVNVSQRAQEQRFAEATRVAQATAASRLVATATPLPRPYIYVVRTGDNLTSIAQRFGVPLDELMRINRITDPDLLRVGQELIIPIWDIPPLAPSPTQEAGTPPPLPTAVPWVPTPTPSPPFTKTPTPTRTPVPGLATATPSGPARVVIRGTRGAGDLERETLILANEGGEAADLSGWFLRVRGELGYAFPHGFTLPPGGEVALHTGPGEDTETDLFWGLEAPLWGEPGLQVVLEDAEGHVVARYPP
jgi:LysM repeat protein